VVDTDALAGTLVLTRGAGRLATLSPVPPDDPSPPLLVASSHVKGIYSLKVEIYND